MPTTRAVEQRLDVRRHREDRRAVVEHEGDAAEGGERRQRRDEGGNAQIGGEHAVDQPEHEAERQHERRWRAASGSAEILRQRSRRPWSSARSPSRATDRSRRSGSRSSSRSRRSRRSRPAATRFERLPWSRKWFVVARDERRHQDHGARARRRSGWRGCASCRRLQRRVPGRGAHQARSRRGRPDGGWRRCARGS